MIKNFLLDFIIGGIVGFLCTYFGYPFYTWQYWVVVVVFGIVWAAAIPIRKKYLWE